MALVQSLLAGSDRRAALLGSLDARMARQKVISNNIANINTPGYHRREVRFEEQLSEALDRGRLQGARTNEGHMALGRPRISDVHFEVWQPVDHTMPSGINNVDIDHEMAMLAENQIGFNHSLRLLKSSFEGLNAAIRLQSRQ